MAQIPMTKLLRIVQDGKDGGTSHDTMMARLKTYPYSPVKPSSAFAPPGADLELRMKGWEDMPYPQTDTIQELQFAVTVGMLSKDDLSAVQDAIEARSGQSGATTAQWIIGILIVAVILILLGILHVH